MTLSEFEKQRQENIERNKQLLRQLDLDTLAQSIKAETPEPSVRPKRKYVKKPKEPKPAEPMRKSRRLAGIKTENEDPEEFRRQQEAAEERERERQQMEKLKKTRLFGDFNLIDLVTDAKGALKHEDKVLAKGRDEKENDNEVKKENDNDNDNDNEVKNEDDSSIAEDEPVLKLLQQLGDKFSTGDFYELIRSKDDNDKDLAQQRKEFDSLKIHPKFDPLDIKLSHYRITSINFHPATDNRMVMAGDTNGNLGIWAVDDTTLKDEPSTTILKPHGKSISKVITPATNFSQIYTGSYDGSVRLLDLNKMSLSELAFLSDDGEELGVSDINMPFDSHVLYMTTLSGNFFRHDTRTPFKQGQLLRLHDKKIGGFSINPNSEHQLATASLDRTLRLWDLRNVGLLSWSEFDDQQSPHMYGSYRSRLSVSTVDWNSDNRLVCNGYDDKICLFDLSSKPVVTDWASDYELAKKGEDGIPEGLVPFNKIRHNCQTGRWVSILKARWQPKPADGVNKFVIANMNRGLDVYNQNGDILAHLTESVGAVPAVATLHPTRNWVVGGSASGKIYMFE